MQCCFRFCCRALSYVYIDPLLLKPPSPNPNPNLLCHHRAPSWTPRVIKVVVHIYSGILFRQIKERNVTLLKSVKHDKCIEWYIYYNQNMEGFTHNKLSFYAILQSKCTLSPFPVCTDLTYVLVVLPFLWCLWMELYVW